MKKHCLVVLLLLAVLLSLSSCSKLGLDADFFASINPFKKSSPVAAAPAQNAPQKSETPKAKPSQSADSKQVEPPAAPVSESVSKATEALLATAPEPVVMDTVIVETTKGFEPMTVSYTGKCFTLEGTFYENEAIIDCNNLSMDQVYSLIVAVVGEYPGAVDLFTFSMEESTLRLGYDALTPEEINAYLSILATFVDSYDKSLSKEEVAVVATETSLGEVVVDILPMEASITLPVSVAKEDVEAFISDFVEEYPEVAATTSYTYDDGVVTIAFAEPLEKETVETYWNEMEKALQKELPPEEPTVEEVVEEAAPAAVSDEVKPAVRISEEIPGPKPMTPAQPKTKSGFTLKEKSFSVVPYGGMDAVYNGLAFGLEGRFEARPWENISLGAKLALEKEFSVPMALYARYDIASDIYAFAGLGVRLALKDFKKTSFLVEAGVGYEWELTDELKVFAEAAIRYAGSFGIYGKFGGRYSF